MKDPKSQRTEFSAIGWTDYTFNPWIGCTKIGPGCENCYAERKNNRYKWTPPGWGKGKPRKRTSQGNWKKVERWHREATTEGTKRKVFCGSLCDIFDEEVSDGWRGDLFRLIEDTPNFRWLLLTKRVSKMADFIERSLPRWGNGPENAWLGVTAEDQLHAEQRIPILLSIPAVKRFVSVEPMLGPIVLADACNDYLNDNDHLDWVIVGGESGPKARPMLISWARNLRDDCEQAEVAYFFKQLSAAGNPDFKAFGLFPKDLQVQEFPIHR